MQPSPASSTPHPRVLRLTREFYAKPPLATGRVASGTRIPRVPHHTPLLDLGCGVQLAPDPDRPAAWHYLPRSLARAGSPGCARPDRPQPTHAPDRSRPAPEPDHLPGIAGRSVDADHAGAHPVRGAATAGPDPAGHEVLLGAACPIGRRAGAAVLLPGGGHDLVVAPGAGAVRRQILSPRLALHDARGDDPTSGNAARPGGIAAGAPGLLWLLLLLLLLLLLGGLLGGRALGGLLGCLLGLDLRDLSLELP